MTGLIPTDRAGWINAISRPLIYLPPLVGIATSFTGKYRSMVIGAEFVTVAGVFLVTISLTGWFLKVKESLLPKLGLGIFYLVVGPLLLPVMG